MTSQEIASRAQEIYDSRLRAQVETDRKGQYIAIDIESGDYEIGVDRLTLSRLLRSRHHDATISTLRIGYPAVGRMGTRNRPIFSF